MSGDLVRCRTNGAIDRADEVTVIVLRKPDCGRHVDSGEAFRFVRPLFETNGLEVGDFVDLADGFLFSVQPRTEEWNDTERNALAAGLSCLGSIGFSGYIAQKALEGEVAIDAGTVALGLVALAATAALAAGCFVACAKGVRAIGRHLGVGRVK
ncbi:hypothetical protein [Collinsella sp. AF38-3AC]|uniref:hypothetical protein n=1 Tax=Collinsella sp. AF38-3AC TaxID=2292015 RepID=UPI000E4822E8|nr:hypothetical protein [Collinsella sp. AF38-3AC]RHL25398.1 hypothetical protein DW029_02900 [Collinsella sp. AF38-3AC]